MTMHENLLTNLPASLPEEMVDVLVSDGDLRIERIVSTGQASPEGFWYDQEEHEWVLLLEGSARLMYADGRRLTLEVGDHVMIPAHERHRVDWTDPDRPTVWLAVFWK